MQEEEERVERALLTQCLSRAPLSLPSVEDNCQPLGWRVISFPYELQRASILCTLVVPAKYHMHVVIWPAGRGQRTAMKRPFFPSFLVREYRSMASNRDQRFYRIQPQEQFYALYYTLVWLIFMHQYRRDFSIFKGMPSTVVQCINLSL